MKDSRCLKTLFANYKMPEAEKIAEKMLADVERASAEEIGRALVSKNIRTQTVRIINQVQKGE